MSRKKKNKFPCFNVQAVTDAVWLPIIVWTDDSKLLQESNLTARHPRGYRVTLYILSFDKRCRLAREGLANSTGIRGANSGLSAPRCHPLLDAPEIWYSLNSKLFLSKLMCQTLKIPGINVKFLWQHHKIYGVAIEIWCCHRNLTFIPGIFNVWHISLLTFNVIV